MLCNFSVGTLFFLLIAASLIGMEPSLGKKVTLDDIKTIRLEAAHCSIYKKRKELFNRAKELEKHFNNTKITSKK